MNPCLDNLDCSGMASRVESLFREIAATRMADLPLLNPVIGVHAIGFRPWEDGCLGVLITPWCMNLLSLPGPREDWTNRPELSEEILIFPSGPYRFTIGHEPALGKYRMCSLFSPMFEFADDNAAVETAEAVMKELCRQNNRVQPEIDTRILTTKWRDKDPAAPVIEKPSGEPISPPSAATIEEKLERPISRRALLRGALFREDPPT